jgi:hypothetical protein
MATRAVTLAPTPSGRGVVATWTGLLNGDDGSPIDWLEYADKTFQVFGTFGTGGSCQMEYSNDGTNWVLANNPQGTTSAKTTAGGCALLESALYVRPRVTAGDGTTSLTVKLFARR